MEQLPCFIIKMEKNMQTKSVYVMNLCVPCENRCRYCLLSYNGKENGIDYKRSEIYAKRFYDWIQEKRPDLSFVFGFGYSMEHPNLMEAIDFLQKIDSPTGRFLQLDGMKFREEGELRSFLIALKEHGIQLIDLTFYGTEDYHDKFAARKGDFAYMMSILRIANEIGLPVEVGIPVSHENVEQLEKLISELEKYELSRLFCFVPHSEGKGALLNNVRFSQKDYDSLSDKVKKYLNTNRFKTEKDWLHENEFFAVDKRMVALTLTPENIDQFEQMSFDETIAYLEKLDDEYYRVVPDMDTLMEMYGDTDSDLFYSARDLYLNYQRRYIEEQHIEVYDINDERQCFSRRY